MKELKRFMSHNGSVVRIYDDNGNYLVQLRSIAKAIGYSYYYSNSIMGAILRNVKPPIQIFTREVSTNFSTSPSYFILFSDVFRLLEDFLKTQESVNYPMYRQKEFDFNTKKLLEQFREIDLCNSVLNPFECIDKYIRKSAETSSTAQEIKTVTGQLRSEIMTEEITTLTEADIEDIGKRANLIKEIFDVPKSAALQATIKLKAEEIGRNLEPLIELLGKN